MVSLSVHIGYNSDDVDNWLRSIRVHASMIVHRGGTICNTQNASGQVIGFRLLALALNNAERQRSSDSVIQQTECDQLLLGIFFVIYCRLL